LKRKSLIISGAAGAAAVSIAAALVLGPDGSGHNLPPGAIARLHGGHHDSGGSSSSHSSSDGSDGSSPAPSANSATVGQSDDVPYGEATALAQTLGITPDQAVKRLKEQDVNADKAASIDAKLGNQGAGSYLDPTSGSVQTNVLTTQAATTAKAEGATPHLVTTPVTDLDAIQAKLDDSADSAPQGSSWAVDVVNDKVSVLVAPKTPQATVDAFLTKAGVTGKEVSAVAVKETGAALKTRGLIGGDSLNIYSGGVFEGWCSAGFLATTTKKKRVLLTAGHCTQLGTDFRRNADHRRVGHVVAHQFGPADWAEVSVDHPTAWHPTGAYVNRYTKKFSVVSIKGDKVAPVNAWICKSGQTSHWTCGRVLYRNWSGTIVDDFNHYHHLKGLTATSLCTLPGDSGGSVIWNSQAQGLISAGDSSVTSCKGGKLPAGALPTVIQPIAPVLKANHLSLLTRH
jgi:streptogrisin D